MKSQENNIEPNANKYEDVAAHIDADEHDNAKNKD